MASFKSSSIRTVPWIAAAVLAVGAGAFQVHAQGSTPGTTPTSPAEMQRGIPGVDIDLGTNERAASNGVPGIDVDVRSQRAGNTNGVPGVDVDARVAGAGPTGATAMRPPIQDRN